MTYEFIHPEQPGTDSYLGQNNYRLNDSPGLGKVAPMIKCLSRGDKSILVSLHQLQAFAKKPGDAKTSTAIPGLDIHYPPLTNVPTRVVDNDKRKDHGRHFRYEKIIPPCDRCQEVTKPRSHSQTFRNLVRTSSSRSTTPL